jgi:pyruvate dehydrogenase E2 component (dihydrolipoamide acetyltransferase)
MGMSEGLVVQWNKKVGDQVVEGELLAEIETEKAAQELESPSDGVLTEILVQENERAKVRAVLGIIEAPD